MQLTKEDFDNAVKQKYNGKTCLVAQAMIREGVEVKSGIHPVDLASASIAADRARTEFDIYFRNPGDENKPELQALRASLPITI